MLTRKVPLKIAIAEHPHTWAIRNGSPDTRAIVACQQCRVSRRESGAEIAISEDGRFVYVENRGNNELVVYRVNPESGTLSLIQRTSSGGDKPWGFAIHPSGKWLLVAN